ncbi:glutaminase GtaA [Patellaria atrata CBS 101060]|uniref:Glutaminase GtaA n=1 Tax=Patellaria atrata CBS 101060 TaxID=1346257 RepID=A0A9P4S8Z6_9PEZI|nr:glutaminase GtaA [Patellaria atrata CBS 101060]
MWISSIACLVALTSFSNAASTFSPARPPAIPLAVRSPYLSTWLPAGRDAETSGELSAGVWPSYWTGDATAWTGFVRVDGRNYRWMGGADGDGATQVAFNYTSTQSIFTFHVGDAVELTATFLSPLYPNDFKRQSLVFSYLHVDVASLDGNTHDVQVYTDISAEWVSGDRTSKATWDYGTTGDVAFHKISKAAPVSFGESRDQAEWGNWYYATNAGDATTYQSGPDVDVRGAFTDDGKLKNSKDEDFRAINDRWPVFAFAVDLSSVDSSGSSALFSIGLCQEQAVQFSSRNGYGPSPALWKSYFEDDLAALSFFHGDFETELRDASTFDRKVADDSIRAGGEDYLTITSLTARQTFGATQLTGTEDKPYLFFKEISSNGNMQTVDVVFPFHPFLLYANPQLLKLTLEPHYEIQESGQYPNKYAMHDIGTHFPNGTGHSDGADEPMPLEECGNMIIMTLAYAQRADDNDYLGTHYDILKQWAEYLIEDSLYPAEQLSTDDFAGHLANQTNLALKGMVGLAAMSDIAARSGHDDDATRYLDTAKDYLAQWQDIGINKDATPTHTVLSYNDRESWGILYNLYADKELGLNFVPQTIYDQQSNFYPTVMREYGVPLDTRHTYTKNDWELWAAAVASDDTRGMFISNLAAWIDETPSNQPMTDLLETDTGAQPGLQFRARPVVGGAFALLIL